MKGSESGSLLLITRNLRVSQNNEITLRIT